MWTFSSYTNDSGYTYTASELKEYFNEIYDEWVEQIQNEIKIKNNIPSFTSTSMSSADTVELKYDSSTGTYSTTLTDSNSVLSLNDGDIEYSNSSVSASRSGSKLTITFTSAIDKDNPATITFNADRTIEKGSILGYVAGNYQKVISIGSPSSTSRTAYLKVYTEELVSLQIAKMDSNGNYVADTTFKISYNADMSDSIGTYTTGSDGTVTIDNLYTGTIYVQEISVPENLILDSNIYSVDITGNETVTYTATNDIKQGYIQVTKYDSKTGEIVKQSGVEFEILSGDTVVETIVTDDSGVATSGLLDYGTYIIRESKNPENYVIATTTESQSVTEDGKIYGISIYNEPVVGSISLTKEDSETETNAQGDATLVGATYVLKAAEDILEPATGEILYSKGETISVKTSGNSTWGDTGEKKTDDNAEISWSNLPMGKYVIEETIASEGYLLADDINVTLTPENNTVSTVSQSVISEEDVIKGKLQISKIGSDGSSGVQDGLEGVEFTIKLYSEVQSIGWDEATTYDVLTTDSTGRATSIDLPYGVYLVKETYTPENYYAGGDFFVTINEDAEIEYRVVNNAPIKAWINLVKTDEDGNEITLSNATFKLKDSDGNYVSQKSGWTYIDIWTTDEDGIAYLSNMVETGTYYVEEITSPDGFLLADEVKVEITSSSEAITFDEDNDPVIIVTIVDEKPTGTIILNKSTENAEDIVNKGIKFQLTANSNIIDPTDGSVIYSKGEIVTIDNEDGIYEINENGYLQITGLPLGSEGASYLLTEVETQDGYVLLEEPIKYDFTIQNNTTKVYEVIKSAENKLTETYFSKTDVDGEDVEGAQMVLTDNTADTVIDEWTSTTEEHLVKGLIYGHEYTLSETTAPDGYVLSTDITFIYSTEIEKVTMTVKQVLITKADVGGQEVEGATIQVIDEDGNIIDEWTSTKESHPISGLEEGKTYTLHEETAPNGYYVATDIEFTVSGDKVNEYHTIVDEKILTNIEVVKIDSSTKKVITGLDFVFTLYADEKCTKEIITVNANTENGTVTFEDLEYGTYYIRETQTPKGYQLSDEVIKVVVDDNLENVDNVYSLDYNNAPTPTVVVKTGDASNIALYAAGLLASAAVIGIVRHKGKKKNEGNDGE
ncbi:MAG: LPXTG cell wall anchor domain-containing protein [Erysipelotrichaceae bacterium]|nr:LPXTG cell wall anchor domain-containing protein [Erysipelotrichaceae bacterium]